jgi:hypothetical protein
LLGVGIGLWLVTQTGLPLLWIGLGGVLTVVMYTAGPFPLAYNALGEVAVGIFMGPVFVLGTYYAVTEQLSWQAVWVALPISFTVAAILHANNIRDMEADRAVNKRTLALLLGRNGAILEYMFLIDGAYLTLVVLVGVGWIPFTSLIALSNPSRGIPLDTSVPYRNGSAQATPSTGTNCTPAWSLRFIDCFRMASVRSLCFVYLARKRDQHDGTYQWDTFSPDFISRALWNWRFRKMGIRFCGLVGQCRSIVVAGFTPWSNQLWGFSLSKPLRLCWQP